MRAKILITIMSIFLIGVVMNACSSESSPEPASELAVETSDTQIESSDEAESTEGQASEDTAEAESDASQEVTEQESEESTDDDIASLKMDAMRTYADLVYASYEDAHTLAVELQVAIAAFAEVPSGETLQAAKDAWLAAREPYGQTEAYRFYGGPIDDEDGPEGLLNAWPLDEAYIDYVQDADNVGIINDVETYPTINRELLISLNEVGAEENISLGYHAIEFLLWGQDLNDDGAGNRPYTDYLVEGGTAQNQERRAQYLTIATELLLENLEELVTAWAPDVDGNYRAAFLASDPDEAFTNILTGIGVLSKSELAGERMFTAYDNQDQEDEHSCFSDNTHRDIIGNAQGIYNVYFGQYVRIDGTEVSGPSISDVVAAIDADLNAEMSTLSNAALEQANNIPVPFDQAIVVADQRTLVLDAVYALQDQGDKIAQIASTLGLTIDTALPE